MSTPDEPRDPFAPPPPDPAQPPAYGQQPPAYGQQPPAYGQQPPAYGQQPPAYGQQPPAYGQQPPAYGQQPPAYGQQPAYGQPVPGYGQQLPAYGQAPAGSQVPAYGAGPYPPPPAYGAYGAVYPKNALAVWSLVLGIASFVLSCLLLTGIPAVILGRQAQKAADEGLADNRTMATIGIVLGWVAIGLSALGLVVVVIVLAAGGFTYGSTSY